MKILTAVSDRDLLAGIEKYLTLAGYDVVGAFDGVQAATRLAEEKIDLSIVEEDLPRMPRGGVFPDEMPVAVLTKNKKTSGGETKYLSFPFSPAELSSAVSMMINDMTGGRGNE